MQVPKLTKKRSLINIFLCRWGSVTALSTSSFSPHLFPNSPGHLVYPGFRAVTESRGPLISPTRTCGNRRRGTSPAHYIIYFFYLKENLTNMLCAYLFFSLPKTGFLGLNCNCCKSLVQLQLSVTSTKLPPRLTAAKNQFVPGSTLRIWMLNFSEMYYSVPLSSHACLA